MKTPPVRVHHKRPATDPEASRLGTFLKSRPQRWFVGPDATAIRDTAERIARLEDAKTRP